MTAPQQYDAANAHGRLLLQLDLAKGASPDLRDVPLILDIARTDEQRHVFEILMGMKALGRPYFVAPEVPKERADALRAAAPEARAEILEPVPLN